MLLEQHLSAPAISLGSVGSVSSLTLIRGGVVWAPAPLGRQDILVAGGQVVLIQPEIRVPSGWPIREIDVNGRIVPGLIDQHIHLLGGGGTGGPATARDALAFEDAVSNGLTTIVGCLGYDSVSKSLTALLAKCRSLRQEGITALMYTGGLTEPTPCVLASLAQDVVLIPEVIGIKGALQEARSGPRTVDEMMRLAGQGAAAELAGKQPRLHLHIGRMAGSLELLDEAIDRGLAADWVTLTHCNISSSILDAAIKLGLRGVRIDMTAALAPHTSPGAVDPVEAIRRAVSSGVDARRITLSSDSNGASPLLSGDGNVVGAEAHRPAVLVDAFRRLCAERGMEEALPMLTLNVAQGLGLSAKGRIAEGSDADLVVLSESLDIEEVWANGVRFVAARRIETGGFFARSTAETG